MAGGRDGAAPAAAHHQRRRRTPLHGAAARRAAALAADAQVLIAGSFTGRVTLEGLARTLGVSPFALCRAFRQATGGTVHQHLTSLRLATALEQLPRYRERLTDLALDLGFSSHSHFTQAFRSLFRSRAVRLLAQRLRRATAPLARSAAQTQHVAEPMIRALPASRRDSNGIRLPVRFLLFGAAALGCIGPVWAQAGEPPRPRAAPDPSKATGCGPIGPRALLRPQLPRARLRGQAAAYAGLGLRSNPEGVVVVGVQPGPFGGDGSRSPSIWRGDLIVSMNGQSLDVAGYIRLMRSLAPGDTLRGGLPARSRAPIPTPRSRAAIPTGSSAAWRSCSTTRRTGEGRWGEDWSPEESSLPRRPASSKIWC